MFKINESVEFKLYLLNTDGQPATGATVTSTVYDESDSSFNNPSVTEIGSTGLYTAAFTPDAAGEWTIVFACSSPVARRAYTIQVGKGVEAAIETKVDNIATKTEQDTSFNSVLADIDSKVTGKQQIAITTEDLNQTAATYDLFTGTTQDVLLESLLIRMPDIAAGGALTSISIQTDDTTPQVLISAADGAVANLTAEAQLAWQNFNAPILIKVGTKVQLTIAGGAHGVAYVCDIVVKTRAVTSGGYLG